MNIKKLAGIAMALATLGLISPAANAGLIIQLQSGATTVTIADGSGLDQSSLANVVQYSGSVGGNWLFNLEVGISYAPSGEAGLHMTSIGNSIGAGTVTMSMWSTDVSLGVGAFNSPVGSNLPLIFAAGGAGVGTVSGNASLNGGVVTGIGPLSAAPSFAAVSFVDVTTGSSFNLGQSITLTHIGAGGTSIDSTVSIPEPAVLGLLGLGLLGFGFARRRVTA